MVFNNNSIFSNSLSFDQIFNSDNSNNDDRDSTSSIDSISSYDELSSSSTDTSEQLDNINDAFRKKIEKKLEYNLQQAELQKDQGKSKIFKSLYDTSFIPEKFTWYSKIIKNKLSQDLITEEVQIDDRLVGISHCQGKRNEMQDSHLVCKLNFEVKGQKYSVPLFGIFDGHGEQGEQASAWVAKILPVYFVSEFEKMESLNKEEIWNAIKRGCKKLGSDYNGPGGTTACVGMMIEGKLWIANIGDSRAILSYGDRVIQLSEDQMPDIPRYSYKVYKEGGCVISGDCPRVGGRLAMARAIGDKSVLGICSNPKITCIDLKEFEDSYLVISCDGLYEVTSTSQVGSKVKEKVQQGKSVTEISKYLVYRALECGSRDNVSVLVVKLT